MQRTDVHKNGYNASTNGGHRQVAILAFPVMVSLLSQTLMSTMDIALLGHFGTIEQGAAGGSECSMWRCRLPVWLAGSGMAAGNIVNWCDAGLLLSG